MSRPRLVILSAFLTPFRSGAEACAEEVSLALKDEYEITIVTARLRRSLPRHESLDLEGKVQVIRVGLGYSVDKWLYPFLAPRKAKKLQPQIIHAVLETFAGLALRFCRSAVPAAKRVLTLQTLNRKFLKGMVIRSPDVVTAISVALVKDAARHGRNDAVLIPNGIHLGALEEAAKAHPKVQGRILFVGRLEPMKGVDTLLRAFAMITYYSHVHIVGEGSQRGKLEQLTVELGVADRVKFTGYLQPPELYREFAEAEIFCGLSRTEALGNVFLEAMAAGCAVVATSVGGIVDTVRNGETGILVAPDKPDAAAQAIRGLLFPPDNRYAMAEAARKFVQAYDWAQIARRYDEVYKKLLIEIS